MDHNEVHKGDHLTHVGHSPADVNSTESLALEDKTTVCEKHITKTRGKYVASLFDDTLIRSSYIDKEYV